jgi:hypothetical protein
MAKSSPRAKAKLPLFLIDTATHALSEDELIEWFKQRTE